jgi:hypothetical protein
MQDTYLRLEKVIIRKQFSVPVSSIRDGLDEMTRLEDQASF